MNNNKTRGISGLSILLCVLVLAGVYWFMSQSGVQQTAYTYQDFQKDLKKEKVESVEVKQNKVAPTGTLKIRLKNDDIEQLHVSDVNSAEDLLESYDISYSVDNVPQDSWMSTTLVPIILMAGIMVFVVMMMNRQGGSNAKAMNFGKSRAKMSTQEENHVTFAQVAGLQEEKEEFVELMTRGQFVQKGGSYYITYKETETTGYEGCTTTLKIAADGSRVAMLRFGKGGGAGTQLLIEKGKRNLCHYETGYGSMTLGVTGDEIECGLTEKGGTAKFGYLLDANSAELVSRNRLEVTVTHVN